ncbi:MAG TPA: helix-turn-helix domain-containing protein [Gaiellaceae bacterium]|jgi:DNA-binding IclR family transcriptional regulator|nr:helix-turn-helix domain-containing protein [Gaiellaceae bacterium]
MPERPKWAFLTSHGFMLLEVARNPDATVRELAEGVAVTERQAHRVLSDLVDQGYLLRERVGRRNRYRINRRKSMRHGSVQMHPIGDLLEAFNSH